MWVSVTSALAYNAGETITVIKSYKKAQAPGVVVKQLSKKFFFPTILASGPVLLSFLRP